MELDDEDAKVEDDEPSNLYMPESTVVPEKLRFEVELNFEVDFDVNITSYQLLYLLSDEPIVAEAAATLSLPPARKNISTMDLEELLCGHWPIFYCVFELFTQILVIYS